MHTLIICGGAITTCKQIRLSPRLFGRQKSVAHPKTPDHTAPQLPKSIFPRAPRRISSFYVTSPIESIELTYPPAKTTTLSRKAEQAGIKKSTPKTGTP
ncbi:hypothetical protein MTP99_013412 [Tenebrio molitor]|nr:hypothetical protein MTP99_013412 [Tenebrio molitor]